MLRNYDQPATPDFHTDASESLQQLGSEVAPEGAAVPAPRQVPAFVEQFTATIRTSPCATNATSDYTDARYYLDRAVPTTSGSSSLLSTRVDALPGVAECLTATNLAELASRTHLVPAGTVVQVFSMYTRSGTKVRVFNHPPPDGVVMMITGTGAGGGKYTGNILSGSSTAVASGNLSMPEGMSSGPGALILNEEETGLSGHRLQVPSFAVGQLAGSSNGTAVVMIRGALGASGGATALGDGSGGSVDPDSTSWDKSSDGTPLDVWVQTRTFWDTASGTLYGYLRKFSFDARGVLYAASGENQITIDVATACE
jgi:hypothetical protein